MCKQSTKKLFDDTLTINKLYNKGADKRPPLFFIVIIEATS